MSEISKRHAVREPVLVDGATGYIGSHLVWWMTRNGLSVRCLVRETADSVDIEFLKRCGAEVIACDLQSDSGALDRAFEGVSTAVHLIGSIAPRRGERLEDLHAGQTRCLIKQCKRSGVTKLVMVTALGSSAESPSVYHRTKRQSEIEARASGLRTTILRPSLVIGRQAGNRESKLIKRLAAIIKSKRMVPLVGSGNNLLQPVFVGDLTEAIQNAVLSDEWIEQVLEIGGPDVVTMRHLVGELMRMLDERKPLFSIPLPIARLLSIGCERLQPTPTLSQDQVLLSQMDNICDNNQLPSMLKRQPTPLAEALETYRWNSWNAQDLEKV